MSNPYAPNQGPLAQLFPGKQDLDSGLEAMRHAGDVLRQSTERLETRIKTAFVAGSDEEICYHALWIKQVRDLMKDLDAKLGHLKRLTAMRASHLWLKADEPEDYKKLYGHGFKLFLGLLPNLPKKGTVERAALIKWLQDGGRSDCLAMDEATGEWVFDYDKMTELVNQMVEQGMPVPPQIKTSADTKLVIRALNA